MSPRIFPAKQRLVEPDKLSDFGWFGRNELPQPISAFAQAAIAHLSEDDFS